MAGNEERIYIVKIDSPEGQKIAQIPESQMPVHLKEQKARRREAPDEAPTEKPLPKINRY